MDPKKESRKLFDWKQGGSYAWKAAFPLTRNPAAPASEKGVKEAGEKAHAQ